MAIKMELMSALQCEVYCLLSCVDVLNIVC